MGLRDIWPYTAPMGGTTTIKSAPMTAGATGFLPGEVVSVVAAGTVTPQHKDGNQLLLADAVHPLSCGIALNGPGAAATAELTAANGWGRIYNHPDSGDTYANSTFAGGAVGSPLIWYVPFDTGNLFVTRIVITAGGATAGAAFTGADRGDSFQITYCSGPTPDVGWGLERTVAVLGTDFMANVVDILDANGKRVNIAGTGTFAVFEVLV
jgi:hypothetical protein